VLNKTHTMLNVGEEVGAHFLLATINAMQGVKVVEKKREIFFFE
jgi:hypothetical protein